MVTGPEDVLFGGRTAACLCARGEICRSIPELWLCVVNTAVQREGLYFFRLTNPYLGGGEPGRKTPEEQKTKGRKQQMKHNFKRFLSLLLALVMVLGMMPMGHARAASAPESGKTYLIVNTRSGKLLTNQNTDGNNGLLLDGTLDDIANATIWTIEGSDGVYTVKDSAGNYLKVSNENATASSESATVSIGVNGSTWTINYDGYYLNQFGGGDSVRAAGWKDGSAAGDPGSQWILYEYVPVNMEISDTYEVIADGNYEQMPGNEIVSVDAVSADKMTDYVISTTTTDATLESGRYVLMNTRVERFLENTAEGGKLWLYGRYAVHGAIWTITKVDGGYTAKTADGQYMTFTGSGNGSTSGLTDTETVLSFTWKAGTSTWQIGCNGTYLNSFDSEGKAGGYSTDGDGGSQWKLYKLVDQQANTWTRGEEVTETPLAADKYYIFENTRSGKLVSNQWNHTNDGGSGSGFGLKQEGTKDNFNANHIWKVTAADGGYNVTDIRGWYLEIGTGKARTGANAQVITIGKDSTSYPNKWQIAQSDVHLNGWGGQSNTFAGWREVNGDASQFNIYEVTPTPQYTSSIIFTGLQAGTTGITIGNTVYAFTVTEASEPQLTTAAQLNDGSFVALEDCEYTLVVDTNGNRSLVHGGTYYVMPKGDRSRAKVPQGINRYTLTIEAYNADDNYVTIYGHNGNDDGYLYFHSGANEAPEWNRNSVIVEKCAISLFRADANSTNTEIYGYTRVKASELEADGRYLIAVKHANGSWYVMAPSTSTNNKDHIAQVVATEEEIHDHTFGEWTVVTEPTCTTTGTKTQSCDCGHVHTEVIAIDPEAHTAGDPVVENETAASYDQVVYCTECDTELSRETINLLADKVVVSTIDVSLDAEIMLKYGVIIPEELIEGGAYIVLTKDGGYGTVTKEFKGEELAACKSDDKYVVAIGVASGEMNSPVKIEVFDGQGNALDLYKKDGTALDADTSSTVVDFAERVLTNDKNGEGKKNLAVALVTYGGYAQKNFSINPENPAYGLLDKLSIDQLDLSEITADSLAAYTNSQSNSAMGVKATGISTFVDSYIYIRVFLAVEGDISAYTFTLDTPTGNVTIEPVFDESTNRYYVDIPDIASAYIDFKYSITVTKGEESNVITTSVLSYARSVLKNSQNSEEKKNLVRALYLYNQAANTFFND